MKLNLKIVIGLFCLAAFTSSACASVILTTFGNSVAPTFALDASSNFATKIQSASSIQIGGLDNGNILAGYFSTTSIVGNSSVLTLTGSVTTQPSTYFNMTLIDTNGNTALYQGAGWSALGSSGFTTATFVSNDVGFNFASVNAFQLDTAGSGSALNATLTGLTAGVSAVPEPSRTLLGMLSLGFVALRRRRSLN